MQCKTVCYGCKDIFFGRNAPKTTHNEMFPAFHLQPPDMVLISRPLVRDSYWLGQLKQIEIGFGDFYGGETGGEEGGGESETGTGFSLPAGVQQGRRQSVRRGEVGQTQGGDHGR
ncbi:MAG: hypothetical protein NTY53_08770 [Kiritimatiellaeota bacterium]|nr:hypothetical protein [Kiritimatiellota bacterium]